MSNQDPKNQAQRVLDKYVAVQPGQPYRLLPFGPIKRAGGGPAHNMTPELAAQFRLPHFFPPVKLGSHADETPAGGHIRALFVRNEGNPETDGLWASPTLTEKGAKTWADGDYRYHSPEIIWPGGGLEDATTGEFIPGPLIVGDALLHVPALGEATALYTSQIQSGETNMPETVQVEKSVWEGLVALFGGQQKTPPAATPPAPPAPGAPDQLSAMIVERDQLKAKLDQLEAEKLRAQSVATLTAELQKPERFSAAFRDAKAAATAADKLASMTKDQQDWVMQQLGALAKRIDYSRLTAELGDSGDGGNTDPRQAFAAAVQQKMKTAKCSYVDAYAIMKDEAPDLFQAYAQSKGE